MSSAGNRAKHGSEPGNVLCLLSCATKVGRPPGRVPAAASKSDAEAELYTGIMSPTAPLQSDIRKSAGETQFKVVCVPTCSSNNDVENEVEHDFLGCQ